jgi:hypothetical protein
LGALKWVIFLAAADALLWASGGYAAEPTAGPTFSVDRLRAEAGWLTDAPRGADGSYALGVTASVQMSLSAEWDLRLEGRADGLWQTGFDSDYLKADYGDSYVRYRGENFRFTLGTQTIRWGRTDEMPPTDRVSRVDLTRGVLDSLADRRRALPAVRLETYWGDTKLDLVGLPYFRGAALPDDDSVWHPVDRQAGRLLGYEPTPLLSGLVRYGSFGEDDYGAAGWGARLAHSSSGVDYGMVVIRARPSLPYYRLDSEVADALRAGAPLPTAIAAGSGSTFTEIHPFTWGVGGDLEFEAGGATWRAEALWSSDLPVTTESLEYQTVGAVDWVAGVELFPGFLDGRITLQLYGHHALTDDELLEREDTYGVNGEVEHSFANGRWRFNLRFLAGLDARDVYVNPKLTYAGFDRNELYVAGHWFSGESNTLGGYYQDNDLVAVGWQARF